MLDGKVLVRKVFESPYRRGPRSVAVEKVTALAHEFGDLRTTVSSLSFLSCSFAPQRVIRANVILLSQPRVNIDLAVER